MRLFAHRAPQGRHAAGAASPRFAASGPVHQVLWGAPVVQRQVDPRRDPTRFDTLHQNLFVNAHPRRRALTAAAAARS